METLFLWGQPFEYWRDLRDWAEEHGYNPEHKDRFAGKPFMCIVKGKQTPVHEYKTIGSAEKEAQRLCIQEKKDVAVVQVNVISDVAYLPARSVLVRR